MIKKILFVIIFVLLLILPVNAQGYDADDIYNKQYNESGLDSINDLLDEETKRLVEEFNFYPNLFESYEKFTIQGVFSILKELIVNRVKAPLTAFLCVLAASVLLGAVKSAEPENKYFGISDIAGISIVGVSIVMPAFLIFKTAVNSVKSAALFISGFIPIFAGVLISSGRPTTSTLTSASLLISAEVCEQICSYIILPFVGVHLAISIASVFSDRLDASALSSTIKKTVCFCMSTVMAVFSAVLSVQTIIGNSADSVSLRAFRFIAGSTPIIGGAVSEATGIVSTCINTLKNSAVIYAVICLAAILLPIIIEILMWRAAMFCSSMVANMFGSHKISELCNSVGYSFGIVTSVTVNTFIMFVISLTVIMLMTGNAL